MASVTEIWETFNKELKAFVLNKIKNLADTEDLLQDVFIKIMQNLEKVSHSENIRQYLYGIVRNAVYDYFKAKRYDSPNVEAEAEMSQEENNDLNERIIDCCLQSFIEKLPERYKEAVVLTEFDHVPQKELAERLNISYSGAKSRVQRGREKLKELILGCCAMESDVYGNLMEQSKPPQKSCETASNNLLAYSKC
jgi:RNA polymerase sigma-70 factor, ECF subfamily